MSDRLPASQTLDRGITVAEAVVASGDGATIAELARYTGYDRAVVHRLVLTLVDRGWVLREREDNRYRPGPALRGLEENPEPS